MGALCLRSFATGGSGCRFGPLIYGSGPPRICNGFATPALSAECFRFMRTPGHGLLHQAEVAAPRRGPLWCVALQCAQAEPSTTVPPVGTIPVSSEELAPIREKVAEVRRTLGDRAGVPETPDKYQAVPKDARWLTAAEAKAAFAKANPKLENLRWWKIGVDPATLAHALREPAAVISGCVAAHRAGLDDAERSLLIAKDAAEFLLWAQGQADTGVFPFPSARGVVGNPRTTRRRDAERRSCAARSPVRAPAGTARPESGFHRPRRSNQKQVDGGAVAGQSRVRRREGFSARFLVRGSSGCARQASVRSLPSRQ